MDNKTQNDKKIVHINNTVYPLFRLCCHQLEVEKYNKQTISDEG
jgi:ribonuclease HIII